MGGLGDLEGLERLDIVEGDREDGNDEREVRRFVDASCVTFVFQVEVEKDGAGADSVVEVVPLVGGRCISTNLAFVPLGFR